MNIYNSVRDTFRTLYKTGILNLIPDEPYLKMMFYFKVGYKLDLKNPKTFNEKLNWLKLHDRKPVYQKMVDKYEAKKYAEGIIGKEYIIPTLGVWDKFDDIDFDKLPDKFVLKSTHDSGGVVICKDKSKFDKEKARQVINRSLKNKFFYYGREWPYKDIKPRIIAEEFITNSAENDLKDYKFYCFGGIAKCIKVDFDRFVEHHANFYDIDGQMFPFGLLIYPPQYDKEVAFPSNIDKMKRLAEALSSDMAFLRADFYDADGKVYLGELTFYPDSGFGRFSDFKADEMFGKWLEIPAELTPENKNGGGYLIILDKFAAVFKLKTRAELVEYKFFCFNGEPEMILVCKGEGHGGNRTNDLYDLDFNHLPITLTFPNTDIYDTKPKEFDEMINIARKLSKDIPFLRVDLYLISGNILFGETTFFHDSGYCRFKPTEWDNKLGEMLELYINKEG